MLEKRCPPSLREKIKSIMTIQCKEARKEAELEIKEAKLKARTDC
jgi:hypothetical protein